MFLDDTSISLPASQQFVEFLALNRKRQTKKQSLISSQLEKSQCMTVTTVLKKKNINIPNHMRGPDVIRHDQEGYS